MPEFSYEMELEMDYQLSFRFQIVKKVKRSHKKIAMQKQIWRVNVNMIRRFLGF